MNKNIAICAGLWLAEGDNKTTREITFTNNSFELIELFHKTIFSLFNLDNHWVYSYGKKEDKRKKLKNSINKTYTDIRAKKPHYIYRIASVIKTKEWKTIVKQIKEDKIQWIYLLQGFFAGEGNIKTGSHKNRTLRIAQKNRHKYLENIFQELNLTWSFEKRGREYNFSSKHNWDVFAKYKIANLHPVKKKLFWNVYNSYSQKHYKNTYLKQEIYKQLTEPKRTKNLSKLYKRSIARICEVLIQLKKEGKVINFKAGKSNYWIRTDNNSIIISKLKNKYLNQLNSSNQTSLIAKKMNVSYKSAFNRLKELEKLGLVKRQADKTWKVIKTSKTLIIVWVILLA